MREQGGIEAKKGWMENVVPAPPPCLSWIFTEDSIIWFAGYELTKHEPNLFTLIGPKQILISKREELWMIFEVYKLSAPFPCGVCEGAVVFGNSCLVEGSGVVGCWYSVVQLLVLPTNSWFWQLYLAPCFPPQGLYQAKCSTLESFKCLSSGPSKPQLIWTVWE